MKLPIKIVFIAFLFSCGNTDKELETVKPYEGPTEEMADMVLYRSESATKRVKLVTPLLQQFANGNQEFPKGVYLEFYNEEGQLKTTLKANEAKYFKEEDHWRGRGDVVIKNVETKEQLNTEELFWKPSEERMYTEKFVKITLPDQVLYGTGLDAKQDLSEYTIKQPEGEFYLDE
ncbi:LPS export ABC transporter periplasmic protein LptC [Fulvivirga lutea]|uniref:LPS export ABC transporter periplasmic protein LptC n=1 Tax=Fulvivirga lutea TaxID=2810512 RepID=A0A975A1Z1_9BACT|nr:LPS export ABC transporter periplasmic protein LptC [Fulvivirga lutea]QSE98740.1 LPS export ABC transporter periplasmic protein LptC [Fulvivirga lutea]